MEEATPAIQERISSSFARQGLMAHLGARLEKIEPGRVHIQLAARPEVTQQHGYFHAGVVARSPTARPGTRRSPCCPHGSSVLSVEFKMNLLAPADGEGW